MFLWALGSIPPPPPPLANISLPTSRLQLSHRHPRMRSQKHIHQFFSQIFEDVQVFSCFETIFYDFFFSFTMVIKRSGAREHRGESAAFLAIDQHPVCPNTARCELWPRKWFLFGWVDDTRHVNRCKLISTRVWSHQLTSDLREVYFFGYACNGRVWSLVKAVSLPSFVLGGLRGSTATSGSCCFPLSIYLQTSGVILGTHELWTQTTAVVFRNAATWAPCHTATLSMETWSNRPLLCPAAILKAIAPEDYNHHLHRKCRSVARRWHDANQHFI